jgi:hypothetical protein
MPIMRSARALHLGLVLWLTACVALVVPAHHHDHSAPDQPALSAQAGHNCHHGDCERSDAAERNQAPAERHDHTDDCSICHFASGVVRPHPVDVTLVRPELLEIAAAPEPATIVSRQIILPFHGRAPPAAA